MHATWAWFRDLDRGLWSPGWLAHRAEAIFRVALSLIFIVGGIGHFVQLDEMRQRIDESPWRDQVMAIGDPAILLWLSGGVFILFGLLLALGLLQRLSALLLFVTLVPITLSVHVAPGHVGSLLKNVASLGALLFIYAQRGRVR
ncbi:MAG: DoxX family membrane protein [Sphingopyxis sp.]